MRLTSECENEEEEDIETKKKKKKAHNMQAAKHEKSLNIFIYAWTPPVIDKYV